MTSPFSSYGFLHLVMYFILGGGSLWIVMTSPFLKVFPCSVFVGLVLGAKIDEMAFIAFCAACRFCEYCLSSRLVSSSCCGISSTPLLSSLPYSPIAGEIPVSECGAVRRLNSTIGSSSCQWENRYLLDV